MTRLWIVKFFCVYYKKVHLILELEHSSSMQYEKDEGYETALHLFLVNPRWRQEG